MVETACLSEEDLSAYIQGLLPEQDSQQVERHLTGCLRCEECVAELERSGDWLTRHLRLTPEIESADERWQNCLHRLREIPVQERETSDAEPVPELQPARRIYHYELGTRIGQGGMGVVYRSHHPQLHRPVAIKLLSDSRATEPNAIARFKREMRAAGVLDHPGIVRALDAGVWEGTYYFVMEFIEGTDLSRLVHRCGPLEVADACALVFQAAEALHYAHRHQVLHRDIKPSNLILTHDGAVKILDFGLARVERGGIGGHDATTMGRLVGTLDYLSPEQASGDSNIGEQSDVYGLGATLYRLLSGRPPHGYSGQVPLLGFLKILTENDPPPIEEARRDVPRELASVIARSVAREPEDRPKSAGELAELLAPFAEQSNLDLLSKQAMAFRPASDSISAETVMPGDPMREEPPRKPRVDSQSTVSTWLRLFAASLLGVVLCYGGLTFWLETGKGRIKIESDVDNVSLQLLTDGEVTESIEVHPGKEEVRVNVGKYLLRLDGAVDSVRLDTSAVTLMRGDTRVVRIVREPQSTAQSTAQQTQPAAASGKEPIDQIHEHLTRLETQWKQLQATLGDGNAETAAALQRYVDSKQEILRVVTGETPDAKTSRGRTYQQWTDIVLRETDPATVIEAIQSLTELSTETTHVQTFATLIKIAAWNDSREETRSQRQLHRDDQHTTTRIVSFGASLLGRSLARPPRE